MYMKMIYLFHKCSTRRQKLYCIKIGNGLTCMIKSFFFESLKIGVDIEVGKQNKLANWYKKVGSVAWSR